MGARRIGLVRRKLQKVKIDQVIENNKNHRPFRAGGHLICVEWSKNTPKWSCYGVSHINNHFDIRPLTAFTETAARAGHAAFDHA